MSVPDLPDHWHRIRENRAANRPDHGAWYRRDYYEANLQARWLRRLARTGFASIPDDWLTPFEWRVFGAYFLQWKTCDDIGRDIGKTGSRTNQIARGACRKLFRKAVRTHIANRQRQKPIPEELWPKASQKPRTPLFLVHAPDCETFTNPLPVGCTCQAFARFRSEKDQERIERGRRLNALPPGKRR